MAVYRAIYNLDELWKRVRVVLRPPSQGVPSQETRRVDFYSIVLETTMMFPPSKLHLKRFRADRAVTSIQRCGKLVSIPTFVSLELSFATICYTMTKRMFGFLLQVSRDTRNSCEIPLVNRCK